MATVFWDMRGVLLVEFQEHSRIIMLQSAVSSDFMALYKCCYYLILKLRYEQNVKDC